MGYNQIKNTVVPSAKRTAQAAQQVLARLPNTPALVSIGGQLVATLAYQCLTAPLTQILQNPMPFLVASSAGTAAATALLGPAGAVALIAAGAAAIVTYAVLAAAILAVISVALAAVTVYNQRVAIAKAVVVVLESI